MIKPNLKDDALLADIAAARSDRDNFHIWWLGQSGFLVQWQGRHLLFDPYLSDSLTRKYAETEKPHVRMTQRAIDPARLDFIDVVTSSHNHTDHLDAETLGPLLKANPNLTVVVPEANRQFAADRLQVAPDRLVGADDGKCVDCGDFQLHGVPAAHETVDRDAQGRCQFMGFVARFGPWSVYHSGDTVVFDGLADRVRPFSVDVALVPINGRAPERKVAGNMWGREAARLARGMGAKVAIPCHYDMFEFNTATPVEFTAAAQKVGQGWCILQCGERWSSSRE